MGGEKTYARDERIIVAWKQISVKTGNIGMKGETRGDRDKWRGVGDVMEIGTDFGDGKYNCKVFTLLLRFSQFTKRTGTRYISMVFFK